MPLTASTERSASGLRQDRRELQSLARLRCKHYSSLQSVCYSSLQSKRVLPKSMRVIDQEEHACVQAMRSTEWPPAQSRPPPAQQAARRGALTAAQGLQASSRAWAQCGRDAIQRLGESGIASHL